MRQVRSNRGASSNSGMVERVVAKRAKAPLGSQGDAVKRLSAEGGLKGRAGYLEQSRALQELGHRLNQLGRQLGPEESALCRMSLNETLDFFEGERQRLDAIWMSEGESRAIPKDWLEKSSQISAELQSLQAKALELSVELDLQQTEFAWELEESSEEVRSRSPVARCFRQYQQSLELMLERCKAYQELTQALEARLYPSTARG